MSLRATACDYAAHHLMRIALGNRADAASPAQRACGWKLLFHPSRVLCECVGTED